MLGEFPPQPIHKSMQSGLNITLSRLEILSVSPLFISSRKKKTTNEIYHYIDSHFVFFVFFFQVFLYPPSQDSVLQVTGQSYNSCDLKDPILSMTNGNSLFNITSEGEFFFISGQKGHCEKRQKLQILVGNVTATAFSPAYGPSGLADSAPSYPTVFGAIPAAPSSSSALRFPALFVAAIVFVVREILGGTM